MFEKYSLNNINRLNAYQMFSPFGGLRDTDSMKHLPYMQYYDSPKVFMTRETPLIPRLGINFRAMERILGIKEAANGNIFDISSGMFLSDKNDPSGDCGYIVDEEDYRSFWHRESKVKNLDFRVINSMLEDRLELSISLTPLPGQIEIDKLKKLLVDVELGGEVYTSIPELVTYSRMNERVETFEANYFYPNAMGALPYKKNSPIDELSHPGNKLFIPKNTEVLRKIRSRIYLNVGEF